MKRCDKTNCQSVAIDRSNYCEAHQLKPTPPPGKIIREGWGIEDRMQRVELSFSVISIALLAVSYVATWNHKPVVAVCAVVVSCVAFRFVRAAHSTRESL